jgi:hypothetical protein
MKQNQNYNRIGQIFIVVHQKTLVQSDGNLDFVS